MMTLDAIKELAQKEFEDGNFGSASYMCEYLEKQNINDPKYHLLWATSQSRMENWAKAEKLYVKVVNNEKATKQQKSLACLYLAKQQIDTSSKEKYADMAMSYYNNDFVLEMVSQIYKDLELVSIIDEDKEMVAYYRKKYAQFIKTMPIRKKTVAQSAKF
jgi:hypothetical protein